jgi:microcystin-dependent protein
MASYPAPDDRRSNTFNETDYLTTPAELASVGKDGKYVKIGGDFMSGALSAPSLSTNELTFPTGVQTQPFTDVLKELVGTMKTKTQNLASPVLGTTEINGLTATNNLRLYNGTLTFADASVQTRAFSDADRINLDACVTKTTSVSYDPALLKTTVANSLHATTFTTGSFNSSHLSGTTSNVQQQLVDSNLRTRFLNSSQPEGKNRTLVGGTLDTNFINLYSTETETATLKFSDDTRQSTAFQDSDKADLANVMNRTQFVASYQTYNQPGTTVVDGNLHSNFVRLYDTYNDTARVVFPDQTTQSSAFTTAHRTKLNSVRGSPIGAVQMFVGITDPPSTDGTQWMKCDGRVVTIAAYPELYALIGNSFAPNDDPIAGLFYLPDTTNLFIKGAGTYNSKYNFIQVQAGAPGSFQGHQVGSHKHQYTDQGNTQINVVKNVNNVSDPVKTDVANDSSGTYFTGSEVFTASNVPITHNETRPNCMFLTYIICVK